MSMNGLEHYYSGDKAWQGIVNLALLSWKSPEAQTELLRLLNGDRDLAAVVFARIGENSPGGVSIWFS